MYVDKDMLESINNRYIYDYWFLTITTDKAQPLSNKYKNLTIVLL